MPRPPPEPARASSMGGARRGSSSVADMLMASPMFRNLKNSPRSSREDEDEED